MDSFPALAVGVAAGVVGSVLVAPVVAPLAVGALGFSAAGPIAGAYLQFSAYIIPTNASVMAGTFAAATQAGIGNVVAGSLFAGAQSVAMGGALPVIGSTIAGVISGTAGLAGGAWWFR